jgi:uncharacterized protein (TIGR02145 family)
MFTASVLPVTGATSYLWTLPVGLSAPSLTTIEPTITITGTKIDTYTGSNISVVAMNACGVSAARAGGSGSIWVTDCATIPNTPGPITFTFRTIDLGRTIRAVVSAVTNATAYVWTLPNGLSPQTATTTLPSLTITGDNVGSYDAADIKVAAKICDNVGLVRSGADDPIVVAENSKWGTVAGASGTVYQTYDFGELGKVMVDNSREGEYSATTYPKMASGERGYYYSVIQARDPNNKVCPAGWVVPTYEELYAMRESVGLKDRDNVFKRVESCAGRLSTTGNWQLWGESNFIAIAEDYDHRPEYVGAWAEAQAVGNFGVNAYYEGAYEALISIRCILKETENQ